MQCCAVLGLEPRLSLEMSSHPGCETLTQQGCSLAAAVHLSPSWAPTDGAPWRLSSQVWGALAGCLGH